MTGPVDAVQQNLAAFFIAGFFVGAFIGGIVTRAYMRAGYGKTRGHL